MSGTPMLFDALVAAEFIVRAPAGEITLETVLQRASLVQGKILAACERVDGEETETRMAVIPRAAYEPHFRSTYRGKATSGSCLVLSMKKEEKGGEFLSRLLRAGVRVNASYSLPPDDGWVRVAVCTSDDEYALALFTGTMETERPD